MDRKYKVGGYVKLAKLWERSKDAAVAYHSSYYTVHSGVAGSKWSGGRKRPSV